jgi:hypothetical protein
MPNLDPAIQKQYETIIQQTIDQSPTGIGFTPAQIRFIVETSFRAAQIIALMPPKMV